MADKFDQLCDCAIISLTPADIKHLEHCSPEYEEEWKRVKVNAGSRHVMADACCRVCRGSGENPSPQAAA